jgi:hypothetical protein
MFRQRSNSLAVASSGVSAFQRSVRFYVGRCMSLVDMRDPCLGSCSVQHACCISRGVELHARWYSELWKEGLVETET